MGLSLPRIALGVALILSLPLIAMHFTDSVAWSVGDFVAAGVLLSIAGGSLELAHRRAGNLRIAIGVGAVGIAAAILGTTGDAPGLTLLGAALVASACVVSSRARRR